ncbi:class I SAM-dependent methyltransferase [Antrihabitans sp. NCIMB 15449]|uniref:Class I SAM-dependent methyltransferase n=1 Tax=Antrihabitans spumae TaxID=3373370 RepID=A0ABW7JKL3_9NOCA
MTTTAPQASQADVEAFLGRFVVDFGAALASAGVILGDRLGLYRALAELGSATPEALAERTDTDPRYVREWLSGQAAGGYVDFDGDSNFSLTPAQVVCLADSHSPTFLPGAFEIAASVYKDADTIIEAFRTGRGVGWHEHHHELFAGTERFFRPGYAANLVDNWIPALRGAEAKLLSGARVADVGCGHGASTIIMAQGFPRSTFVGYDYHEASVVQARRAAEIAGVSDRVRFEVAGAADYAGTDFDLVTMFDCLHDMGDPVGAARHVRESLNSDGTLLLVEPMAGNSLAENLNPVGRVFYSASTFICTPASRAQDVGACLGAQAGEQRLEEVARQAGFTQFRRAAETPFNMVLEAKP